ncbi:hypothetical protein DFS34DRAFT_590514 [Phlyctochytrium arcticum]|nr:hypothetical protein DFS34DRAFT_590514 [Phlyctochytrium arcticum]
MLFKFFLPRRPVPLPTSAAAVRRRYVQTAVSQLKRGQFIELKQKIWVVQDITHHRSGRGGAHYKVAAATLEGSSKIQERFTTTQNVEVVDVSVTQLKFLYHDGGDLHLFDEETLQEHTLPDSIITERKALPLIQAGMDLAVTFAKGGAVSIQAPERASFKVLRTDASTHATAGEKGTNFKTAWLSDDTSIQVPDFIQDGENIIVDLTSLRYVSRE